MITDEPAIDGGRRPGRPRDQRADRAIIGAALEQFADEGYAALSIEAIAAQAQVSKATVYRRWAGKRELVLDALASLNDDFPDIHGPATDRSARELLVLAMRHMAHRDADSLAGRIMPRMMIYSVTQPDLYAEYFERVIMPRRRWLQDVLRKGIERGELRADLDVELAVMALVGPVLLQSHRMGRPTPDADFPDRLMDILWPGLRAAANSDRAADANTDTDDGADAVDVHIRGPALPAQALVSARSAPASRQPAT